MSVHRVFNFQEMKTFNMVYNLAGFYGGENISALRRVYIRLSDSLILAILVTTVFQLVTCPSNQKESLSVSLVVSIAYSLALYYSLCFRLNYSKIVEMTTMLENIASSFSVIISEEAVIKFIHRDVWFNKIYVVLGLFTASMSAILFSIQPLLRSSGLFGTDGQKVLQIDTWCPYDCHAPVAFEVTVFVQFVTVFWVAVRFFANDSFYMFVIKLNIQFFKLLTSLGENVLNCDLNIKSQSETEKINKQISINKRPLKLLQIIYEDEGNCNSNCDQFSYYQNSLLEEFNGELDKMAYEKLKVFIKHHQIVLRCAKHTCQVYGLVFFLYLLCLIGFLSVSAFGVVNTNGFEGVQSVAVALFSIVNLVCMYFMSEAGDQLALQSGSVAEVLFHGLWYKCSRNFRSSLIIVIQQANNKVQACVFGVPSMPLSCTTFAWVIKTMVSLYLFMVEVQRIKKA